MAYVAAGAAAVSLGTAAFKYGKGRKQIKKGEALERSNVNPVYTRPGEVTTALNLAERNYNNGMPGKSLMESRLGSNAATAYNTAVEGSSSSGDLLDAATKINLNTNFAGNDLNLQESNYKSGAMNNYIAQLQNNAQYADKEFQYNQDRPFQEQAAKASSLIGAGNQNEFGALNDVGQVASSALMSQTGNIGGGLKRGDMPDAITPIQANPIGTANNRSTQLGMPNSAVANPITTAPQIPNSYDPASRGKMVYDPQTSTWRFL